jgi:protein-disulfide isomerase
MKRFLLSGLLLALVFLNGCTADKKIAELTELVKKLEARIEALEKVVTPAKEEPAKQQAAYDIPVGESYVLGNKDAKVHITVFSNFQCPYCARADKALRELTNDPKLKDKINVVFKHFPFDRHPEAKPASKAAMAAGEQGKFWEMSDKIFSHQDSMNEKNYQKWAKEIGLNLDKFKKDLKDNDQKYNDLIDKDIKLGAETAKLEGTPWILVGGWLLEGDISAATINKMIEEKKL